MDQRDVSWYSKIVYMQMNMLQAEITMQGMIAENTQRAIEGKSPAYTEAEFVSLIDNFGIHHNNFPFCGE